MHVFKLLVPCNPFSDKAMAAANMLGYPQRPAWIVGFGGYSVYLEPFRSCVVCFSHIACKKPAAS